MHQLFDKKHFVPPWIIVGVSEYIEKYCSKNSEFKQEYKTLLSLIPEFPKEATRIGIEIEVENAATHAPSIQSSVWAVKPDGSLRNHGLELVSPALVPGHVREAIAFLHTWIKTRPAPIPDFSWRTSDHVHLECSGLSSDEFKCLLLLYFLFEGSLFQWANPGRFETNIFCGPITKTNYKLLGPFFEAQTPPQLRQAFDMLNAEIRKYSALNLGHMYDFGTVEFRHLRGTANSEILAIWINILLRLFHVAKTVTLEECSSCIRVLNTSSAYDAFTELIFGEELSKLLSGPTNHMLLSRGVSFAKEFLFGESLIKSINPSPKSGASKYIELKTSQSKVDRLKKKAILL